MGVLPGGRGSPGCRVSCYIWGSVDIHTCNENHTCSTGWISACISIKNRVKLETKLLEPFQQ